VGDGRRRQELERMVEERRARDFVLFTGRVPHDQILDYYALLDVFVIPRVPERAARLVTPLKPFEAMAAGVPLVTSDLKALLEIIGDGERGLSFSAGNAESLASVLSDLEANPDRRKAMATRGRDWVVSERQWTANGKRYGELYERLRARRRS
jgi:glycosyltransferase involved in cell wall biosynthesis